MGIRIKKKRESLSLHLKDVAEKMSVSVSLLSQIENGKAFPSILTLKKIADTLKTTVGELIGEKDSINKNPLVKFKEMQPVELSVKLSEDVELYSLTSKKNIHKNMSTYIIRLKANSASTDSLMIKHHGQEFCHIKKGRVNFFNNDKSYVLNKGDSIYYNSNGQHHFVNMENEISEVIWISTPHVKI